MNIRWKKTTYTYENYTTHKEKTIQLWKCPCCGYPTLKKPSNYEICYLCGWEDEGHTGETDEESIGGANGSCSIAEGRQRFQKYLAAYNPEEEKIQGSEKIFRLKRAIVTIFNAMNEENKQSLLSSGEDLVWTLEDELGHHHPCDIPGVVNNKEDYPT
jgi:hypothetical protein